MVIFRSKGYESYRRFLCVIRQLSLSGQAEHTAPVVRVCLPGWGLTPCQGWCKPFIVWLSFILIRERNFNVLRVLHHEEGVQNCVFGDSEQSGEGWSVWQQMHVHTRVLRSYDADTVR